MIAGTRETKLGSNSYRHDPLYAYAKAFTETAQNILTEDTFDFFAEPAKSVRNPSAKESLKAFFTENFVDDNNTFLSPEDIEDLHEQAEAQFENDVLAMESTYASDYNPMVGMALPIHKLILMNNVFSQGNVVQKVTAVQPNFTISMESRVWKHWNRNSGRNWNGFKSSTTIPSSLRIFDYICVLWTSYSSLTGMPSSSRCTTPSSGDR